MAARSPDSIAHKNVRSALLFAYSVLLGGVFGVFAAFGMDAGRFAAVALLFGAFAGLFTSPALIFALRHGPVLSGLAWISVPTAIAAYVGGVLTPPQRQSTPEHGRLHQRLPAGLAPARACRTEVPPATASQPMPLLHLRPARPSTKRRVPRVRSVNSEDGTAIVHAGCLRH